MNSTFNSSSEFITSAVPPCYDCGGFVTTLSQYYQLTPSWSTNISLIEQSYPSTICSAGWGNGATNCQGTSTARFGSGIMQIIFPEGEYGFFNSGANLREGFLSPASPTSLLEYSVYFPSNFQFGLMGYLPGLYAGPMKGCSYSTSDGSCWSVGLRWKASGVGEIYAILPPGNEGLCRLNSCPSRTTAVSIAKGSFSLTPGQWHTFGIFIQSNDVPGHASGQIQLWFNGNLVAIQLNVLFTSANQPSLILPNYLSFTAYFGGNDTSYGSPIDTFANFQNFTLSIGNATSSWATNNGTRSFTSPLTFLGAMMILLVARWMMV